MATKTKARPKPKMEAPPEQPPAAELLAWVQGGMANYKAGLERRLAAVIKSDMSASDLALIFAHLRHAQDCASDANEPLDEAITKLNEVTLPEAYLRDQVTSVNTLVNGVGYRVTASYRFFANIIKDMKDKAYEYLRANQMGDLIQETVNAGTLTAEAKKMLEDGKELPENLFTTGTKPGMSLTKIPEKK